LTADQHLTLPFLREVRENDHDLLPELVNRDCFDDLIETLVELTSDYSDQYEGMEEEQTLQRAICPVLLDNKPKMIKRYS
jgi:hypothetical protein